ncbi:MAG: hypothetical protein ACRCYY_11300 [Trueperaceae bacterium]
MSDILVAGHLCLDIILSFAHGRAVFTPGHLTEVGAATFATGGAVSNVGLALLRLGVGAKLVGKIADDFLEMPLWGCSSPTIKQQPIIC